MMLYIANWGHRRIMFRFPEKEVDFQQLQAFEYDRDMTDCRIQVYKKKGYVVIDIDENQEEGFDYWVDGEGILPAITPLWTDIYKGNYASLYLIWLHFEAEYQLFMADDEDADDYDDEDEMQTPPVPPGMKTSNTTLAEFMKFWGISVDLLAAAAEVSPEAQTTSAADWKKQIQQLSEEQKTTFLTRLLLEEPAAVQMDLQKYLLQISTNATKTTESPRRTLKEILLAEEQYASQRIAEAKRIAAEQRLQELKKLEQRQPQAWQTVQINLAKRTGSSYEHAVNELKDLRDLAIHLNQEARFGKKLAEILDEFGKSKALLERLQKAGLV